MKQVKVDVDIDEDELGRQTAQRIAARANSMQRRIVAQAKAIAPIDTGHLARSIDSGPIRFTSPYHAEFTVIAKASYARYVHDGTRYMRPRPFLTVAAKRVARASVSRR